MPAAPGRFVHHFLAVEHGNAQISPRQLKAIERHDAATHDDNVVRFHEQLSKQQKRGRRCTGRVTSAILRVH